MNRKSEYMNRRKSKRFKVMENIFAVLKPNYTQMGQVIDINKSGLSFQYIDSAEDETSTSSRPKLAIFLNKGDIYLDNIPVKTTSIYEIEDVLFYNSLKKMRIGIQFNELAFNQLIQMEYFILNHTRDILEDRRYNRERRFKQRLFFDASGRKYFEKKKNRRSLEDRRNYNLETASLHSQLGELHS